MEFQDSQAENIKFMMRPSGTEPVLRIYAEAESMGKAKSLVQDATDKTNSF
jgi:phosphomannomutase